MKFKRTIALNLIFIVTLSSIGVVVFSQPNNDDLKLSIKQSSSSFRVVTEAQDLECDFLEDFKLNHPKRVGTSTSSSFFEDSQFTFKLIQSAQYLTYLKKQLIQRCLSKLFLYYKLLII